MRDCRLPVNRPWYFERLYDLNLRYGIMPGLVYLYMPLLAEHYRWDAEQRLWFAFLNGMTQNPITSLRLWQRLPELPRGDFSAFADWYNGEWERLQFDVDRRYHKNKTVPAIQQYATLVKTFGSQERMLSKRPFAELWDMVYNQYYSFGRLSAFSYLEYVHLNGFGAPCTNLMFADKDGSRSHRNGMLFLLGRDSEVWDDRLPNGCDGAYADLEQLGRYLQTAAEDWLTGFTARHAGLQDVGQFTLESNLCTFKNHFFGRRYPGVYADMAQERIVWADARGQHAATEVFKAMRSAHLPRWLRSECRPERLSMEQRGRRFPDTGVPFRAEYFLENA